MTTEDRAAAADPFAVPLPPDATALSGRAGPAGSVAMTRTLLCRGTLGRTTGPTRSGAIVDDQLAFAGYRLGARRRLAVAVGAARRLTLPIRAPWGLALPT
ncbi:MAG TPA: hypothetical protein VIX85_11935 [Acidimicrobiales bacterium]